MKKMLVATVFALTCAMFNAAQAQILAPQGRLTLQSNTPVMTTDVIGATTIYYTPYVGNSLPVSNGTSLSNQTFSSQLSLNVFNTAVADQLEDVYAIQVSGAFQLCLVDAWNAAKTARDSGYGLTTLQGIWVNANTISFCATPSNDYTLTAQTGIYLGTVYTSEYPGGAGIVGVTMMFKPPASAGGTRNLLGLWNAYNRVRTISGCTDSTSSWTDSSSSWAILNSGSTLLFNSITFVDGLQQSFVDAELQIQADTSATSVVGAIGVGIDGASPAGNIALTSNATFLMPIRAFDLYTPQPGYHTISAQQWASGSTVSFSTNSGTAEELKVELEM